MDKQIRMEEYAGYQYIEGGVCAAQGFTANGLNCGLNPDKQRMIWGWYTVKGCVQQLPYIPRIR